MNGFFNMNFMMTFLMAKDLPETRDQILMAMTAGQSANLLAPVLLKVGAIDSITNLTQENKNLKAENSTLQEALQACQDGSELERSQQALQDCQAKLAACDKIVAKCAEIKQIMGKVNKARTLEKLKADEDTLNAILTLAPQII